MFNFIFLKKNHILFYNYFLLKNYYYIYFYCFNNFNNNLSLDIFKHHNCESTYFFERNSYKIKHNLFLNFTNKNKSINIKFSNYFNYFLKKTYNFKNVKKVFFDLGSNHHFNTQFNLNKSFINFFPNYIFNKNNFLLLDNEYSHIYPIYKFIFGASYLQLHKNFFFLKPIYFTRKS